MSVNQYNNQGYSITQPLTSIFIPPIVSNRAPTTADKAPIGAVWVNKSTNTYYVETSVVGNVATWVSNGGGGSGSFSSLTVNPGPTSLTGATTITGTVTSTGATTLATTGASANTFGNTTGATSLGLSVGTGNFTLDGVGASTYTIGASTTGGTITIGGTAQTGTITLGSSSGVNTVDIGTGAGVTTVNIANAAVANVVSIGSTTGAASTTIKAGSGGLILNPASGNASMVPATSSGSSTTPTLNARVGVVTVTGLTTANSGASQVITIANSTVLATSGVFLTLTHLNASTNGATLRIEDVTIAASSIAVKYSNNGAGALGTGDNVIISFWVIS